MEMLRELKNHPESDTYQLVEKCIKILDVCDTEEKYLPALCVLAAGIETGLYEVEPDGVMARDWARVVYVEKDAVYDALKYMGIKKFPFRSSVNKGITDLENQGIYGRIVDRAWIEEEIFGTVVNDNKDKFILFNPYGTLHNLEKIFH